MGEPAPPRLELRPARVEDSGALLAWRNDPDTRAASRTTEPTSLDEHERWLVDVLANDARYLLVAELGGTPVGQVRFDPLADESWEISVGLATEHRGSGLGAALIEAGTAWLWENSGAVRVAAEIRERNDASLRAFERAGYRHAGSGETGFVRLTVERPRAR